MSDNTGDLAALKTDSPKKTMDFGWTYSAPWGYALMERIVGGRGLSLKVRKPAAYHGCGQPGSDRLMYRMTQMPASCTAVRKLTAEVLGCLEVYADVALQG